MSSEYTVIFSHGVPASVDGCLRWQSLFFYHRRSISINRIRFHIPSMKIHTSSLHQQRHCKHPGDCRDAIDWKKEKFSFSHAAPAVATVRSANLTCQIVMSVIVVIIFAIGVGLPLGLVLSKTEKTATTQHASPSVDFSLQHRPRRRVSSSSLASSHSKMTFGYSFSSNDDASTINRHVLDARLRLQWFLQCLQRGWRQ